jgi:PIN domain nuclease of toxin-antitoxin system
VIVVDTHVWIWWVDDNPRLKRAIRDKIDLENDVRVSAISLLEIATAVSLERLKLKPSARQWLEIAQSAEQVRVEPLTYDLCMDSVSLPGDFHRDPADRLIVALARKLNVELVTADQRILEHLHLRCSEYPQLSKQLRQSVAVTSCSASVTATSKSSAVLASSILNTDLALDQMVSIGL